MGHFKEQAIEETTTIKTKACPFCNKEPEEYIVTKDELRNYMTGEFVQVAFRNLDANQRERLITGICEECWEWTFGD